MIRFLTVALLAGFTCASYAQVFPGDYERLLLPVHAQPFDGAFGSKWETTLLAYNASSGPVDVYYRGCLTSGGCPPAERLPSGYGGDVIIERTERGQPQGVLMYVPRAVAKDVRFSLRAHDTSRSLQTWGTELPVVRESEFATDQIQLLGIPTSDRFRQTLRVYDVDRPTSVPFRIRFYDLQTNALLLEIVAATQPVFGPPPAAPARPGVVEVNALTDTYPQLRAARQLRAEIEPVEKGIRFWAFASVTNNETQHLTTITP